MALSTVDVEPEEPDTVEDQTARRLPTWSVVSATLLGLLLIIGGVFASHYQPIAVDGGWGVSHPIGPQLREVTQDWDLRNTGPVGVTVVSLKSGEYDGPNSRSRIAPTKICPIETPRGDCSQNATTGLIEGKAFQPFSLTTDTNRPVVLQYNMHCVQSSLAGSSSGTVSFPVTYRFLWFTHTIVLTLPAYDAFACP
jgi:hypothetical protein